jgi:hypothetical protein
MAKDEHGLLNTDYTDVLKSLSMEYDGTELSDNNTNSLIKTLKSYWHELDQEEKENIWAHLHILMILTDKYIKEKALSKMNMRS